MKNILLTSIIFNIIYNYQEIFNRFNLYKLNYNAALVFLFKNLVLSQLMVLAYFLALSSNKRLYKVMVPITFVISTIVGGAKMRYGIVVDHTIITSIFETNLAEFVEFLNPAIILAPIVAFLIAHKIVINFQVPSERGWFKALSTVAILITLSGIIFNQMNVNSRFSPFSFLKELLWSVSSNIGVKKLKLREEIPHKHLELKKNHDDLVVMLVIGESARGDHFSLNGYERDTNPKLSKIQNVISYKNARSCAAATHISVPCMLTRATETDRTLANKEKSVISLFRKLGFKTIWIGGQGNSNINRIHYVSAKDAEDNVFGHDFLKDNEFYDHDLLPYVGDFLKKPGNKLVVIHTMGSHWHYDYRYPQEFASFTPLCNESPHSICPIADRVNSYDNTIYYTDHVLASLVDLIDDKNSLLLYSSDHGESLGENGVLYHAQDHIPEQRVVPFIVYASDKYIQTHPEEFKSLKDSLAKKDVSHDNIFHTLLDCANIKSDVINEKLSLCRP